MAPDQIAQEAVKQWLILCWGIETGTVRFNRIPWDNPAIAHPNKDLARIIAKTISENTP